MALDIVVAHEKAEKIVGLITPATYILTMPSASTVSDCRKI
jgi:hypothetical protein